MGCGSSAVNFHLYETFFCPSLIVCSEQDGGEEAEAERDGQVDRGEPLLGVRHLGGAHLTPLRCVLLHLHEVQLLLQQGLRQARREGQECPGAGQF